MKIDKPLLIDDFNKKSFIEKRNILLEMLGNLSGTSETINELGVMVYDLTEETENGLYTEAYDILLDAAISVEDDNHQEAVDNILKLQEVLEKAKEQEKQEREIESKDLDKMFIDL